MSNRELRAKILIVTAVSCDPSGGEESYEFEVLEFENGLVLVPGETTSDWFFDDRNAIEARGNDFISDVQESGKIVAWTREDLLSSIQGSMGEWGTDSVPAKHLQLWK